MRDATRKLMRVGTIVGLLLCSLPVMAAAKPSAMDRVHAIAGAHVVTITHRNGVVWVEVDGSDLFGTGSTVEEAVNDFLADADLEAHEQNRPHLHTLPQAGAARMDCVGQYCL